MAGNSLVTEKGKEDPKGNPKENGEEKTDATEQGTPSEAPDAIPVNALSLEDVIRELAVEPESATGTWAVGKPVRREQDEILARLSELSGESAVIKQIYENSKNYPDKLLEALANNPEMEYFAEYYPVFAGYTTGGLTEEEKKQEVPLFLQWDFRWGYQWYGEDGVIGLTGCGPTCLSMVLYSLTRDETLTPDRIAAYAVEHGYYVDGIGTSWSLMSDVPGVYGVEVKQPRFTERSMKQELDAGHLIICSMGKGDFTTAGHFIVLYGYDENGFFVHDPNCIARSKMRWTFSQIEKQIKNLWSFWTE